MGSVVVSFRIDEKLKHKMDQLKHINWSEIVRKAIAETVAEEEARKTRKDLRRIKLAALMCQELTRRIQGWNSTEEIRRWREKR